MKQQPRRAKIFVAIFSLVAALIVGLLIFNAITFRLVGTTPNLRKDIPSSTSRIELRFNKEIDPKSVNRQSITMSNVSNTYSVQGSRLFITATNISTGTEYTLSIKGIRSINGKEISHIDFRFKAKYVEFGKISKAEQQLQIDATDPSDALGSVLPHQTDRYYIDFWQRPGQQVISIEMKFSYPDQNNQEYQRLVRRYRKEAFDYLESKGIKVENYKYSYTEQILLNEFPVQYSDGEDFTGDGVPPENQP